MVSDLLRPPGFAPNEVTKVAGVPGLDAPASNQTYPLAKERLMHPP